MAGTVGRRELLQGLLGAGHVEDVSRAVAQDPSLIPDVFRLLYHPDPVLRHRAATVVGEAARHHPGRARSLLERLVWALNDESGNHCPGAAAALAEVVLASPVEGRGFVPVLMSQVEEASDPTASPGAVVEALWAAGRLARAFPEAVSAVAPTLVGLLSHREPLVRALSVRALIRLQTPIPPEAVRLLLADTAEVEYVEHGHPVRRTVRDLVLHETLAPCCGDGSCRGC